MRWWFVFVALFVLGGGYSAVQVFWPNGAKIGDGASFYLGKVSPGHVFTIITDRGPREDPYTGAVVTPQWPIRYRAVGDRMYIEIGVPPNESGTKRLCLELFGEYSRESFCPSVLVVPDLIDFHLLSNVIEGKVDGEIPIKAIVKNASIGETAVRISCSTEEGRCSPAEINVQAGSIGEAEIGVVFPFPGTYTVKVEMEDVHSGEREVEDAQIIVKPSLRSNLSVLRKGIPIYFPFLMPAFALYSMVM